MLQVVDKTDCIQALFAKLNSVLLVTLVACHPASEDRIRADIRMPDGGGAGQLLKNGDTFACSLGLDENRKSLALGRVEDDFGSFITLRLSQGGSLISSQAHFPQDGDQIELGEFKVTIIWNPKP